MHSILITAAIACRRILSAQGHIDVSSEARLMLDKEKINHLAFGLLYIGNCTAMHIFILRTVIANSKIANSKYIGIS